MKYIPIIIVTFVLLGLIFFQVLHYLEKRKTAESEGRDKEILKKPKWRLRAREKEDNLK